MNRSTGSEARSHWACWVGKRSVPTRQKVGTLGFAHPTDCVVGGSNFMPDGKSIEAAAITPRH